MGHLEPEPDMTIWMATHTQTRKVQELQQKPLATVGYGDLTGKGYVTLRAQARLVSD